MGDAAVMRHAARLAPTAAIALVALTGCMPGAPLPSPEPTQTPAGTPAQPSAPTGTPAPVAPPTASALPPSAAGARSCGDEYVLSLVRNGIVGWEGDRREVLQRAQPRPTFEPADAIQGLDVLCVVTYRIPTDGAPRIAVVSEALLERDDDVFAALDAWASEHYYELRTREAGFVEREAPPNPDGSTTRKIFLAPLDGNDPVIANAGEIVRLTGAALDSVLLVHSDFTQD